MGLGSMKGGLLGGISGLLAAHYITQTRMGVEQVNRLGAMNLASPIEKERPRGTERALGQHEGPKSLGISVLPRARLGASLTPDSACLFK